MARPAVNALRVKARGDAVRTLQDQGLTWVTFDPIPDLVCDIDFGIRQLPDFGLLSGTVQGVRHVHAHRDSGDGNNDFSFHLNVSGLSMVAGRRGETTLRDGDAMLLSYSAGRTISRPALVDHRVIRLPRASLAPLVQDVDDFVLRRIPRGTDMLNLLKGYADAVFDDPAIAAPQTRQLIIAQLCDLVAVTIGATRDATAVAEGRGIRAARLRAIKGDIEAHLADGDLTAVVVAKRQKISDSYVRKLFDSEGTSFSDFVLTRRLVRANRMLTDQRWSDRTIASIAFECGFGDLSYFNRTFKRLYGAPPSDIRGH
ncbi:HTH-type transcriptional regulator GadW [Variibacter gotjawalensis]|uniref:HTH-type transcriptional regulator GadW n=1 Tax=Variibacter gotjawalensis TaxID=1333996 RepID=A0A0S3Q070_9BRAD|nr:AraC family transcriptional regulator [Variibacter gotjawalensis]NIK47435.1 AraC-like DNA-binding protein [Variibacter gotjawalensis]RZS49330.1 AraC family transcriptional regulator [Variibacter gotjawalensis]BAT61594.1 HTH-type transcriptional regulator GadW [Variibacter gotjawalensis]